MIDPACAAADLLHGKHLLDEAVQAYQVAIAQGSTAAWDGLGAAQLGRRAFGDAASALRRALDVRPAGATRYRLGCALFQLGRMEDALAQLRLAMAGEDRDAAAAARGTVACIIPGSGSADHRAVLSARQAWLSDEMGAAHAPAADDASGRKLRIGYLSGFFGDRNWMKPVWGVINRHDRRRFEIHMFSDGGDPSAQSGYKDHDEDYVHQIRGVDTGRAAGIIAQAGIDVLVDLNGYSLQGRLAVPLSRPAPVVAGWFNMFATTGSDRFDWLVGDGSVIRAGEAAFYPERIACVPGSYLAFEVLYPVPEVAPAPSLQAGYLTFGCLGSQYKLTDEVVAAWSAILGGAQGARLLLRNAALSDGSTRADLLARFAARGVDGGRITLLGRAEHASFLATYDLIDVALDTFPYNGGTTTAEALWQGVPVLAFDGDRWASRTSASLLRAAGLGEWVTPDQAGYVERAIGIARDAAAPGWLGALRAKQRAQVAVSAACDVAGLCRALERFYMAAHADAVARRQCS